MDEIIATDTTREGPLTLRKSAKLRHRSLVEGVFAGGKNIYDYPLRLTWRSLDAEALKGCFRDEVPPLVGPLQMLVTVPKKKRRHAVDRVLMRRRIREAFRLHSRPLRRRIEADPAMRTVSLAFVYLHTGNESYAAIEKRMVNLLRKLERRLWPCEQP
ncbi:MAG: ribonuclease P protein component [Muribaculaceae bacterium]|nr:ribonuclease P protein component [Muribaculaceae bacterium]